MDDRRSEYLRKYITRNQLEGQEYLRAGVHCPCIPVIEVSNTEVKC